MKLRLMAILLTIPLWACAAQPDSTAKAGPGAPPPPPSGFDTAMGIVETPLLIAFKIPACIALAPLSVPGAIASAVVPFNSNPKDASGAQVVANTATDACGPPYVAQPHYGGP